jgi:excisionase family DNA binding protein
MKTPLRNTQFDATCKMGAPVLYRISSVMSLLEVSRSTVYRMVASKELELVKLSMRASRITSASVARVLAGRNQRE